MTGGEQLLILVVVLGVFWFLMMRPARNQRRQMQQLQNNLAVGDEVVISAGIFGTVRSVEEGKVELEIAPDTVITVASQVVVRRAEDAEPGQPLRGANRRRDTDEDEIEDEIEDEDETVADTETVDQAEDAGTTGSTDRTRGTGTTATDEGN